MNVYGKMQAATFQNEIAENVILESSVILLAGNTACNVAIVQVCSLLAGGVAESCRSEICDFKLYRDAALASVVFQTPE